MKPASEMSRLELAAFVASEFRRSKIDVVLSGGSCVSIYSSEKYLSKRSGTGSKGKATQHLQDHWNDKYHDLE